MTIINKRQEGERGEDSLYFHDRCKEIRLMVLDCLVYPEHLKCDKTLLRKLKILNYALAEFEDFCNNNMMISKSNCNNNK
jgi:hypothetical protein